MKTVPNGEFTVNTKLHEGVSSYAASGQSVAVNTFPQSMNAAGPQARVWMNVANSGMTERVAAYQGQSASNPLPPIFFQHNWLDQESREAYMEATVEQDIAWQIALNRKARNLSQKELAEKCGTRQSGIARLEDPTYGKHSIAMLVKVAHVFGCAVRVKLISYSELAEDIQDTSPEALVVKSFSEEKHLIQNYSPVHHD